MLSMKQEGFSLIELVAFIVVIGIISGGLLVGMNQALTQTSSPTKLAQASFLANARMQIILMNRAINGYATLSDPCTTTPGLVICTPLSSFASTNNFTVNPPTISGSNPKIITLSVTGAGNATIDAYVYDYANN